MSEKPLIEQIIETAANYQYAKMLIDSRFNVNVGEMQATYRKLVDLLNKYGSRSNCQKNRELVADALESGEYDQGNNVLRTPEDKFCCLGVATDIYIKQTNCKKSWEKYCDQYSFDGNKYYLAEEVMRWLGFRLRNPRLDNGRTLSELNDEGIDFKEIAKIFRNPDKGMLIHESV